MLSLAHQTLYTHEYTHKHTLVQKYITHVPLVRHFMCVYVYNSYNYVYIIHIPIGHIIREHTDGDCAPHTSKHAYDGKTSEISYPHAEQSWWRGTAMHDDRKTTAAAAAAAAIAATDACRAHRTAQHNMCITIEHVPNVVYVANGIRVASFSSSVGP